MPELSWIGGPPLLLGSIIFAGFISDFLFLWEIDSDRYAFLLSGFLFGPSCAFFLGASRIINPQYKYGPGTFYMFETLWPYVGLLCLMGMVDFALVIYKDSQITEPPKRKNPNITPGVTQDVHIRTDLFGTNL